MLMRKIVVNCLKKDTKISKYILMMFPCLHMSSLYKALRQKDIKVNNTRISKDINVKNNDTIELYISDDILFSIQKHINYIYEDTNILVAYKDQGILSNNEDAKASLNELTFEEMVKKDKNDINNSIHICHRLDRNTAGLIVFSKNDNAYEQLLKAFKLGYIKKEYIAFVANANFKKDNGCITSYIVKDLKTNYSKVYEEPIKNSKKIVTSYTVLEKNKILDYAKLNIQIHTGKTHQIRSQFAHISHPVIGDSKYGKNVVNRKFGIYKQLLFAYKYTFKFPEDYTLNYLNNITIQKDIRNYLEEKSEKSIKKQNDKNSQKKN